MRNIPRLDAPQSRAGNDLSCATCGKRLSPKRGSRRMRFCGVACRQSAFRAKKWASRYRGDRGRYDQFKIRPLNQGPATAILGIEDRGFAARWRSLAANCLTASSGGPPCHPMVSGPKSPGLE